MSFTLPKQLKDLDMPHQTNLDFWDCFGRKKTFSPMGQEYPFLHLVSEIFLSRPAILA